MIAFLKECWRKLFAPNQKLLDRLVALLWLLLPLLAIIVLLSLTVAFVQYTVPYIVGGGVLLYVFLGDHIDAAIERHRLARNEQAMLDKQTFNHIYRKIAITILPCIRQVVSMELEPEELSYNLAATPFGIGFYYSTPKLLDDSERKRLLYLITLKISGKVGIDRSEMYAAKTVLVEPDYIFIRNDPRILQYFASVS